VIKSHEFNTSTARRARTAIAAALLAGLCGPALARGSEPAAYGVTNAALLTSRGPAMVTGHIGSMETTMLPGSGGQGMLMNNGNGSSMLLAPGHAPEMVITPR
jgi:hypothetical protein